MMHGQTVLSSKIMDTVSLLQKQVVVMAQYKGYLSASSKLNLRWTRDRLRELVEAVDTILEEEK